MNAWSAITVLVLAGTTLAQAVPHIGYVYPAGGRKGSSFAVRVAGQNLRGLAAAFVSGKGVRAKLEKYDPPITQRELNKLREELNKLQKRRREAQRSRGRRTGPPPKTKAPPWTRDDDARIAEIRRRIADRNRRREIPALAELATLRVTIAADAAPGPRDLRLITGNGMTNPVVFCVGALPEFLEDTAEQRRNSYQRRAPGFAATETDITLPANANGQILPGDVDRFRFRARRGQQLVVAAKARALIPYLADAVPGWFQATLALRDAKGRELAFVDDFRFDPDPVLFFAVPEDGEYVVEIRDAIYRGREDFVYRIAIGELPYVTSIFPLAGRVAEPTAIEVRGVNLVSNKMHVAPRPRAGTSHVTVQGREHVSNAVPFQRDTLVAVAEAEPNDGAQNATMIKIPVGVDGRIDQPDDVDVFSFRGTGGTEIVAEVLARRLGSPVDSQLLLTDAKGRRIAFCDDRKDDAEGRATHHADAYLRAKLPRSGIYFLHVAETQGHGGPEYGYRLRICRARPAFDLRIVPSCINARAGANEVFTVRAIRRDGFAGAIELSLQDAPPGFALGGGLIQPGADRVRVTLALPKDPLKAPVGLRIVGRARVGRRSIEQDAVAADDVMQAFIYRHLLAAQELVVWTRGRAAMPIQVSRNKPVVLPVGGSTLFRLPIRSKWARRFVQRNQVQLKLDQPPPGIAIQKLVHTDGGFEIRLRTDRKTVRPGTAGNLILRVFATAPSSKSSRAARRKVRARSIGVLAAIPYRVKPKK